MATALKQVVQITDSGTVLINNTKSRTSTADGKEFLQQSIGTAEETLTFGPDTTGNVREFAIENMDPTNYVELGFATAVYPIRVQPGTANFLTLDPAETAVFLKAAVAACEVKIYIHAE